MVLRLAMSRAAHTLDARLDARVCGSRLAKGGPAWHFKEPRPAFRHYREHVQHALSEGVTEMLQLDVANYFGGVTAAVVSRACTQWPIRSDDAARVVAILGHWQRNGAVDGLPIGPDVSALLGTALLEVVDESFIRADLAFARYMDDARAFGNDRVDWTTVQEVVADAIAQLGLTLSAKKTFVVKGCEHIMRAVNQTSTSLGGCIARSDTEGLHRWADSVLGADASNVVLADFHSILTSLGRRNDAHAVDQLINAPAIMQLDPKAVGEYFLDVDAGFNFGDELFALLDAKVVSPDLEVQLLRAVRRAPQGASEERLLLAIASDEARLPPTRAWALTAAIESCARDRAAEQSALSNDDFLVRRSGVLALKGLKSHRSLLIELARRSSELEVSTAFALSA